MRADAPASRRAAPDEAGRLGITAVPDYVFAGDIRLVGVEAWLISTDCLKVPARTEGDRVEGGWTII